MSQQRGLDASQEQKNTQLIRDNRTIGMRVMDFLRKPTQVSVTIIVLGFGTAVFPQAADVIILIAIIIFAYCNFRHSTLPFRLPTFAGTLDYNDIKPGSNSPNMSRGIYLFGNEKKTNEELWFTNDDMRTHVLIFGSTGSGKTEHLVGIAYNALVQASGFIYVDGKGDNSLFAKIFSMVRYMGREDDLLLINFMTGARDVSGPQKTRLSNTMNPFATGSSSMLSQLVVSMMDSSSSSGDGDMWKGRAIAFVEALMKVMVAMRDAGNILLDANTIRNYFGLDRIEAMVEDNTFIRDGAYSISLEGLPDNVMQPMRNYLSTLPGYNKERKGKQVSQVFEQHGFITMQLTRVFSSLADTYGHIIRTKLAEVDFKDVVLNRRILVVLLPALEKSPDELANLGKVIISSLKAMMAAGLGDSVEGTYHELIDRKPTNSDTPFLCVLDEYGYYAVKGFAVVPAQARSLGFSVVFAGQDLPAFQKASKEEAASIGANTNIKICMKLEDPVETWDFFMKTAGEAYVSQVSGYQANAGSLSNSYLDNKGASMEKRQRVDLRDLKEQREGEGHMFFKSKIVRYTTFYPNPKPVAAIRLNQMVKVDVPSDGDLYALVKGIEDFENLCKNPLTPYAVEEGSDVHKLAELIAVDAAPSPVEKGISSLMSFHEDHATGPVTHADEIEISDGEMSIFAKVEISDDLSKQLAGDSVELYQQPILERGQVANGLLQASRLLGATDSQASSIASELVKDIQNATHYVPPKVIKPSTSELAHAVSALAEAVDVRKTEAKDEKKDEKDKKD